MVVRGYTMADRYNDNYENIQQASRDAMFDALTDAAVPFARFLKSKSATVQFPESWLPEDSQALVGVKDVVSASMELTNLGVRVGVPNLLSHMINSARRQEDEKSTMKDMGSPPPTGKRLQARKETEYAASKKRKQKQKPEHNRQHPPEDASVATGEHTHHP